MALLVARGDLFLVQYVASVAASWSATLKVRNAKGQIRKYRFAESASVSDRTLQTLTQRINDDGEIVGFSAATASTVKRGQFFMNVPILGFPEEDVEITVAKGYLYGLHSLSLGQYVEPGPGGGEGYLFFETIGSDIAGNVGTTYTPAVTNTRRIMYGMVWYYNASGDAANRTQSILMRRPWGATPTGFATAAAADVWSRAGNTMTANQEGTLFVYDPMRGAAIVSNNVAGTVSYPNITTEPNPFPILLREDDPLTFVLSVTSGQAADRYSVYALIEEWLGI